MACYYPKDGSLESLNEFKRLIKKQKDGTISNEDRVKLQYLRKNIIIEAEDFDSLKQSIIAKVTTDWADLNFYSSGFNTQVESVFNDFEKDYNVQHPKTHTTISGVIESINKRNKYYKSEKETSAQEFISSFAKQFGEYVHKFMEIQDSPLKENQEEGVIDEMIKFIEEKRKKLIEFRDHPDPQFTYKTLNDYYSSFVSFIENINKYSLGISIRECKQKINEYFKGYSLKAEKNIALRNSSGNWILGRLDAYYYNEDGSKQIIVDYKTSVNKSWRSTKEFEHYLQLYTYRQILISKHLGTKDNISIFNIQFTYDQNGIHLDSNISKNMDINSGLSLTELVNAQKVLDTLFPETGTSSTPEEIEKIQRNTTEKFNKLFDIKTVQRYDKKYFEEELKTKYRKGEQIYSFKDDAQCNIKQESDGTYTLSYTDGDGTHNAYEHQSAEEIAKLEQLNIQGNLKKKTRFIIDKIKSGNPDSIKNLSRRSRLYSENLYQNLIKYFNSSWTVYPCEALESQGIIIFKNVDGTMDIVSLCDQHSELNYQLDNTESLISAISSTKFNGIPTKSIGNVLKLKALIAFSEWIKTINVNQKFTIGDIKVISLKHGTGTRELNKPFLDCLQELEKKDSDFKGIYSELMSKTEFLSPIRQLQTELTDALGANASNLIGGVFDNFDKLSILEKKKRLRILQYKIIKQFGTEIIDDYDPVHPEHFDPEKVRVNTDQGKLLATVSKLILRLDGLLNDNPEIVTKHGLTSDDGISALYQLLKIGEIHNFTDQGRKVTGFLGGMDIASAYNNPSAYVDYANKRIIGFHNTTKTEFVHSVDESNEEAIKFIKYEIEHGIITGGKVTDALLGNHYQAYIRLLKEIDGQKIPEFKNPYEDNSLNEAEKRYLKQLLWHFNRLRLPDSILPVNLKQMTFAELIKDPISEQKFKDILKSRPESLHMPLKPSSRVRGKLAIMADFINGKRTGSDIWDKIKKGFAKIENPNDLAIDQLDRQNKAISRFETFNIYRDTEESRQSMMESRQLTDFELNFNFLENDMELAYIKEKNDKQLIPYIQDIILQLKLIHQTTGVDTSSQIETILNRVKIMVYGDNLIEAEDKAATGAVGILKKVLSITKLGFRPALMAKEMTVGRLKNISTVAAGLLTSPTGNKVQIGNLMLAATDVFPDGWISGKLGAMVDHHQLGEFTKIEKLNQEYQVTDSDMNSISDTVSADQFGLFNVGERMLYYFSVRPDWYNRNTLFVACMRQDGCWDAHSFDQKTGKFTYDMSKDERFSEFWKHRFDSKLSEKAADQKALYMAMMQEFIKDNPNADLHYGEIIDDDGHPKYSKLPKAYTTLQTTAIKEQIGMLYGMYDHEEKSNFENQIGWNMLTSMLTYLPGDIHRYFMKKGQTSIGSYKHITNAQGERLYYDENGNKVIESKNPDGTNRLPVKEWQGDQVEGLFISSMSVLGKVLRGSWEFVTKGNTNTFKTITNYQLRNSLVFLFNILFKTLFATLFILLIKGGRSDSELDQMSAMSIDTLRRAANDLDFYQSVIAPVDQFGIAGVSFMQDIAGDVVSTLGSGDNANIDRIYTNISLIKDLHLDLEE